MNLDFLKRWFRGMRTVPADDMNALIEYVKRLAGPQTAAKNVGLGWGGAGPIHSPHRDVVPQFIGIVVKNGPDEENDFDDCRYWVKPAIMNEGSAALDYPALFCTEGIGNSLPGVVCATNLCEIQTNSHALRATQNNGGFSDGNSLYLPSSSYSTVKTLTVVVVYMYSNPAGATRYYFWHPIPPRFCQITGIALTGTHRWRYTAREVYFAQGVNPSGAPPGMTGATMQHVYNTVEFNNTLTGIQGNSIDHSIPPYPQGFTMQPIRGNPILPFVEYGKVVPYDNSGHLGEATDRYWLVSYMNAEDGVCQ